MGNYSKYKFVNTAFGGSGGLVVPNGTTAERESNVPVGSLRYNTDLGLIEQYNALGWQSVDAPPTITNIAGTINENTNSTITITGSNFKTGAIISIEGAAVGGIPRPLSSTFVSTSTMTAATNAAAVNYIGGASFDIKISNPSGLGGTLSPAGTIDRDPVWSTAAGTYTVFNSARATPLSFTAADPDGGQTVTYSLLSGSLPAGASFDTSTGTISGFSAVGSDTSSTFTLRATSSFFAQTADRSFTILVKAPVTQSFLTSGTFTPTFSGTIQVLVVAGGGGGGMDMGGGGGGGGVVYNSAFSTTANSPITVTVGLGGNGAPAAGTGGNGSSHQYAVGASQGQNSVFGSITATGGGFGASSYFGYTPNFGQGGTGGSGGGASGYSDGNTGRAGPGTSEQGFAGGGGGGQYYSGGGGGAGGAGAGSGNRPNGGPGILNDILGTAYYWAGGGGGSGYSAGGGDGGIGGGGGGAVGSTTGGAGLNNGSAGGGGSTSAQTNTPGGNAGANTGGGGGGGSHYSANNKGGNGGSGIVIVRF